jgi:hypothetical protein
MLGGAEITQQRPAESMAGETSQQPEARPERTIATVDTHLVLWSTRATPDISASMNMYFKFGWIRNSIE